VIEDPWGSSALERLLHQDKNKGLRDEYFKEEYIAQIREVHGMVQRLFDRVEEWFRENETERKQVDALGHQAAYIQQFVEMPSGKNTPP
jgi:hypothetical protein